MTSMKSDVTPEDAKSYLARKDLFQVFESLLTALLYRRPEDPIEYMEKCMQTAKQSHSLKWDTFLEINAPERGKGDVNQAQLQSDVKDSCGQIFKTEQKDMK